MSAGPQQVALAGGRVLNRYEYGDPDGAPCLFLPGSSSSGLAGRPLDEAAMDAGVRLISLDRPGLGQSDPAPERRLVDWADDIARLLDRLGLDRVDLLGHSAGGAFALAVAHRLADRVSSTVVCAGSGPYSEAWFRRAARISRTSRFYYGLALRAPRLFGRLMQASTARTPQGIDRTLGLVSRGDSPDAVFARTYPDRMRAALEAVADGFRQGPDGTTAEARMICRPWGFAVEEVRASVTWWHGEQDGNVDPAAGRAMVGRLPDATARFRDGGHALLFARAPEVLASLRG